MFFFLSSQWQEPIPQVLKFCWLIDIYRSLRCLEGLERSLVDHKDQYHWHSGLNMLAKAISKPAGKSKWLANWVHFLWSWMALTGTRHWNKIRGFQQRFEGKSDEVKATFIDISRALLRFGVQKNIFIFFCDIKSNMFFCRCWPYNIKNKYFSNCIKYVKSVYNTITDSAGKCLRLSSVCNERRKKAKSKLDLGNKLLKIRFWVLSDLYINIIM